MMTRPGLVQSAKQKLSALLLQRQPRTFGALLLFSCLALVTSRVCSVVPPDTIASAQRVPPNIVMIISDDHGWQDYGFMGHKHVQTPHLDKLAAQSLTFARGYVPTSLCSPSLASMITGRYPHEHQVTGNDPPLPAGVKPADRFQHPQYLADWNTLRANVGRFPTLPKLLAQRGYASLQTGKWWLGHYSSGGFTAGMSHGDQGKGGRHGDEGLDIGRKTMQPIYDFIGQSRQAKQPFMVWYAPLLPHDPHNAPARLVDKYKDKAPDRETAKYWANIEWFDETCGALLDYLEREKLSDNTIVVYVTDNGWVQGADGDARSVRSKRTPYDAGLRTPLMIRWPGKIVPQRSAHLASSLDLLPTLLKAVGLKAPANLPGLNLLDAKAVAARQTLQGALFTHDAIEVQRPAANLLARWMIDGDWKLLVPVTNPPQDRSTKEQPPKIELYRITDDPAEQSDLAAREPQRVQALLRKLDAWWKP